MFTHVFLVCGYSANCLALLIPKQTIWKENFAAHVMDAVDFFMALNFKINRHIQRIYLVTSGMSMNLALKFIT